MKKCPRHLKYAKWVSVPASPGSTLTEREEWPVCCLVLYGGNPLFAVDLEQEWVILRNSERYGDMASELPDAIIATGTKEQAQELAEQLSLNYPGCDYLFYLESDG